MTDLVCAHCEEDFEVSEFPYGGPVKCPHCHCFLDTDWDYVNEGMATWVTGIHPIVGEIIYHVALPHESDYHNSRAMCWTQCISICKFITEPEKYGSNSFLDPESAVAYVEQYIRDSCSTEGERVRKLLNQFTPDMGAALVKKFKEDLEKHEAQLGGHWKVGIVPKGEPVPDEENCCTLCKGLGAKK